MSGQVINSYSTLEQALQDWLARSDITDTTYAPEIIQMAQLRLYQGYIDNKGEYWPGLRVRQMEKALGIDGVESDRPEIDTRCGHVSRGTLRLQVIVGRQLEIDGLKEPRLDTTCNGHRLELLIAVVPIL